MASADRLIEVFNEAKARPAGVERNQYLAEACHNEPNLMDQVLGLLAAHADVGDFLQPPQLVPHAPALTEKPGDRIGRYTLLQQIGEGGCGVVYMAEQEKPVRRRVALKVIKLGMDTKNVIARFEAERQALALMDHPNIAKVLDAGATETGRPYFVMELVRGIKITDYCDQNNLATEDRLRLFTQVCQAIQHAHQKGIIHRDIKPSNILVTQNESKAVPKVIDFGIAKATTDQRLTDKTVFTAFEQFIGTPAYMSPEQAMMTNLDIDTRTDIYALGVLLYELLTGQTPFDARELMSVGLDAMRRIIREQEPARPSTRLSTMLEADLTSVAQHRQAEPARLGTLLRGDLDWIVMKALEKDRTRRYETANGLAADIHRHLANEPVIARPPSNIDRLQKLVRRNKVAFAAASAVVAALILGLGASTWMFVKEKQARHRAVIAEQEQLRLRLEAEANEKKAAAEAAKSQQVAQFLKDMLRGVGPSVAMGRDTTMMQEILDKTAERLNKELENLPEVEAELCKSIGSVYWELGDDRAESMFRRSLKLTRKVRGNEHPAVADLLSNLAEILRRNEKKQEAVEAAQEALAIYEKLNGREHPTVGALLNILGYTTEDPVEARGFLSEALAINRRTLGEEHPQVGLSLSRLGRLLELQGDLVEAESMLREAVRVQQKSLDRDLRIGLLSPHVELAWTLHYLATVLQQQGRIAEAITTQREALAVARKVLSEQHRDVIVMLDSLSELLEQQGDTEAVIALEQERLKALRAVLPAPACKLVDLMSKESLAEAGTLLLKGLEEQRNNPGDANPAAAAFENGQALRRFAAVAQDAGERELAFGASYLAVCALEKAATDSSSNFQYRVELVWAQNELMDNGGDIDEVRKAIDATDRTLADFPVERWRFLQRQAHNYRYLAFQHASLKEFSAAREALVKSTTFFRDSASAQKANIAEKATCLQGEASNFQNIADYWAAEGRINEAHEANRQALAVHEVIEEEGLAPQITVGWAAEHYINLTAIIERVCTPEDALRIAAKLYPPASNADVPTQAALASYYFTLAEVLRKGGKLTEAEAVWSEALTLRRKLLPAEDLQLAAPLAQLTQMLLDQRKFADAEPTARECVGLREKYLPDGWLTFNARNMLGGSLLGQERYAEAEPLLLSGYEGMKQREESIPPTGRPRVKENLQRLVQLYELTGEKEKAAEWTKTLAEFDRTEAKRKAAVPDP